MSILLIYYKYKYIEYIIKYISIYYKYIIVNILLCLLGGLLLLFTSRRKNQMYNIHKYKVLK